MLITLFIAVIRSAAIKGLQDYVNDLMECLMDEIEREGGATRDSRGEEDATNVVSETVEEEEQAMATVETGLVDRLLQLPDHAHFKTACAIILVMLAWYLARWYTGHKKANINWGRRLKHYKWSTPQFEEGATSLLDTWSAEQALNQQLTGMRSEMNTMDGRLREALEAYWVADQLQQCYQRQHSNCEEWERRWDQLDNS